MVGRSVESGRTHAPWAVALNGVLCGGVLLFRRDVCSSLRCRTATSDIEGEWWVDAASLAVQPATLTGCRIQGAEVWADYSAASTTDS